jgi:hypothetical protein
MTKKKKKKPAKPAMQQAMSPKNYILTGRARSLPIGECWLSDNWQEGGLATIVIAREHVTGNLTLGIYLVDIFCLGVKNAHYWFNTSKEEYLDLIKRVANAHGGVSKTDYETVHTLIFGAIDYAESLGFKPHKDWEIAQFILMPRNAVEPRDWKFGKEGKPFFISGPNDNSMSVMNKLNQSLGAGNFDYLAQVSPSIGMESEDWDDVGDDDNDAENIDFDEVK